MKGLIFGFTLGIVTGAIALKKMENSKVPEKALKAAQEKLADWSEAQRSGNNAVLLDQWYLTKTIALLFRWLY